MSVNVKFTDGSSNVVTFIGKIAESGGIAKGKAVYIQSASGGNSLIKLADNSQHYPSHLLGVAAESGSLNDFITVVVVGLVENFDTSGLSESSPAIIHLGTSGALQTAAPTGNDNHLHVGYCKKSNASTGSIFVYPEQLSHHYSEKGVRLLSSTTAIAADTSIGGDHRLFGKGFVVTHVRAYTDTAPTGLLTIDINESGTTILSTKLTIDANEKTSVTAATAAVISDSAIGEDNIITFDVDSTTGGSGLTVFLGGYYL